MKLKLNSLWFFYPFPILIFLFLGTSSHFFFYLLVTPFTVWIPWWLQILMQRDSNPFVWLEFRFTDSLFFMVIEVCLRHAALLHAFDSVNDTDTSFCGGSPKCLSPSLPPILCQLSLPLLLEPSKCLHQPHLHQSSRKHLQIAFTFSLSHLVRSARSLIGL